MAEAQVYPDGWLVWHGEWFRCALGRRGVRAYKREGDGATPEGLLVLRRVLYRADRVRGLHTALPCEPLRQSDGWCDTPDSPDYNRQVRLPHRAHCEGLWRTDGLYDVVGVLGWNDAPAVPGRGSAIFLHVARGDYAPTDGCVALALPDLLRLLGEGLTGLEVGT